MTELLQTLYWQEIDTARLNFEADPAYQTYFTQSQAIWEGADMPEPLFHLLETSNYLSFAHGFRLGLHLGRWAEEGLGPRAADSRPYKGAQAKQGVGPGSIGPCKRAEIRGGRPHGAAPTKL